MRIRLANLLLAVLLILASARLWASLRAPAPQLPPPPAVEAAPPRDAGEPSPPAPAGTEGYEVIVARDLFSTTRGVIPPAPPTAPKAPPKPPVQPKLVLAGVVIVDGEKEAYLQEGTQESRPRKVREGESFAGGTVKAIRPDGVTFVFAGSETTVPLRTPKEAGPAPALGALPAPPPQQAVPRPPGQAAVPGVAGQLRRPPQTIPGVQRMIPAPESVPVVEEEVPFDEGDDEFIDDEEFIDDSELGPEDLEDEGAQ